MNMKIRTRIAPSPTGYPHIGTIWQALINYSFAKKNKGDFIVRIEDTDRKRFIKDAEEKLFQALEWFGLSPDESPLHGGNFGPYRQSERLKIYQAYAEKLVKKGFAYYCFCSEKRLEILRKKLQKEKKPPRYDGLCRNLSLEKVKEKIRKGKKFVIRLKVPQNKKIIVDDLLRGKIVFSSSEVDDQVLLKSDGFPTYHLAVVVDDHLMKISHMVRGEEWLSSAPKHVLLYEYFDWQKPIFVHTPIIRNPDKSKLSKRHGHAAVSWYQEKGYLKEVILNFLCLLGWSHPQEKTIFPLEEFIAHFDLKDLSSAGPIVDLKKLDYLNTFYLKNYPQDKLIQIIKAYFKNKNVKVYSFPWPKVIPLLRERIVKLEDILELVNFFWKEPEFKKIFFGPLAKKHLKVLLNNFTKLKNWRKKTIYHKAKEVFKKYNFEKSFYTDLYAAIEGRKVGLPVFESMEILGKEKSLLRIKKAFDFLK